MIDAHYQWCPPAAVYSATTTHPVLLTTSHYYSLTTSHPVLLTQLRCAVEHRTAAAAAAAASILWAALLQCCPSRQRAEHMHNAHCCVQTSCSVAHIPCHHTLCGAHTLPHHHITQPALLFARAMQGVECESGIGGAGTAGHVPHGAPACTTGGTAEPG